MGQDGTDTDDGMLHFSDEELPAGAALRRQQRHTGGAGWVTRASACLDLPSCIRTVMAQTSWPLLPPSFPSMAPSRLPKHPRHHSLPCRTFSLMSRSRSLVILDFLAPAWLAA